MGYFLYFFKGVWYVATLLPNFIFMLNTHVKFEAMVYFWAPIIGEAF